MYSWNVTIGKMKAVVALETSAKINFEVLSRHRIIVVMVTMIVIVIVIVILIVIVVVIVIVK